MDNFTARCTTYGYQGLPTLENNGFAPTNA